MAVTAATSI